MEGLSSDIRMSGFMALDIKFNMWETIAKHRAHSGFESTLQGAQSKVKRAQRKALRDQNQRPASEFVASLAGIATLELATTTTVDTTKETGKETFPIMFHDQRRPTTFIQQSQFLN